MNRAETEFNRYYSSKNNFNSNDLKKSNSQIDRDTATQNTLVYSEAKKILSKFLGPVEATRIFNHNF